VPKGPRQIGLTPLASASGQVQGGAMRAHAVGDRQGPPSCKEKSARQWGGLWLTGGRASGITRESFEMVNRVLIYKIFRRSEWTAFGAAGTTLGAPIDLQDGYIHFSTAAQLAETAAKHFAADSDLVLLALESDRLGAALKWEPSRGGALFPHLYRALDLSDVLWDKSLPLGATGHIFPEGIF